MTDAPIIYLDVETRRPQSNRIREYLVRGAQAKANLRDPEKIKASLEEAQKRCLDDAPLNPMWAEVAVVAWSDGKTVTSLHEGIESKILSTFNDAMHAAYLDANRRQPVFCGFNISQFDLRLLWTRMLIHGIRPAVNYQHNAKPWSDKVIDLRMQLSGGDRYAKGTLQDWIIAFGGDEREGDIPGAEVPQAIEDGRIAQVVEHCARDVHDCMWLHQRMMGAA